jgi:crotonobetainyl-CoA:carnitine CoA-transferase CaiB-like acyl-CoA transferase
MRVEVPAPVGAGNNLVTGIPLRMSKTQLKIERSFPAVGEPNEEIYSRLLGYSREDLWRLQEEGII